MMSNEVRWAVVEQIAGVAVWPVLLLMVLGVFKVTITLKSGRRVRFRVSWFYALAMAAFMLYLLADVATGKLGQAVFDGVVLAVCAVLYRQWRDHEDDDDDDEDGGRRRRTAKAVGAKARAKLRELSERLKPAPAPRPVPVRN